MDVEEVRALSDEEIAREIEKHHEEWRNLRFQNALGRLTTFHQLRQVRKAIARLKTIQRERTIAADPVAHFAGNTKIRARRRAEEAAEKVAKRPYVRAQAARATRRA